MPVNPGSIHTGQLVELQVSFSLQPIGQGKHMFLSKLRSICILSRAVEQVCVYYRPRKVNWRINQGYQPKHIGRTYKKRKEKPDNEETSRIFKLGWRGREFLCKVEKTQIRWQGPCYELVRIEATYYLFYTWTFVNSAFQQYNPCL